MYSDQKSFKNKNTIWRDKRKKTPWSFETRIYFLALSEEEET